MQSDPCWKLGSWPIALLTLTLLAPKAMAGVDIDGTYRNRKLGLKLVLPEGWRLTTQTGYPALLARITWNKTAVVLSLGNLGAGESGTDRPRNLAAFVAQNRSALEAVNLQVKAARASRWGQLSGWELSLASESQRAIEQIYVQRGNNVLVWTIHCPTADLKTARMEVIRLIELSVEPIAGKELQSPSPKR